VVSSCIAAFLSAHSKSGIENKRTAATMIESFMPQHRIAPEASEESF
jgi:hypothetical protein